MQYVFSLPTEPSLRAKGLTGYTFGPLQGEHVEVHYIDVTKGHDTFQISKKVTRVYYVLSGLGYFTIEKKRYRAGPGCLVEVPPKVEYSYSGKMTLIAFCWPHWFRGNDRSTMWNPDVVGPDGPLAIERPPFLARLARVRVLGKSPVNAYLRLNKRLWGSVSPKVTGHSLVQRYGKWLHSLACWRGSRSQACNTFFIRNRPELELIRRLVAKIEKNGSLTVAVLGCSTGAEAYSLVWSIRSARPDLRLTLHAIDIYREAVEFAKMGIYDAARPPIGGTAMLERMSAAEIDEFFYRDERGMCVRPWIKEGIDWQVGDAGDPELFKRIGPHDIVVANNFLCHMEAPGAERCLRNIARLVRREGYLFVSGIDLEVRTRVAAQLGWQPVDELLEEIHDGDPCLRNHWPCEYAGLEPLDRGRPDWKIRYAAAFRLGAIEPAPVVIEKR